MPATRVSTLLILLVPAVAGAQGRLHVQAAGPEGCASRAQVVAELARLPATQVATREELGPDGQVLRLRWPERESLELVLLDAAGREIAARTVRTSGHDCHELPQTVALIVGGWLERPAVAPSPRAVPLPRAPEPRPSTRPTPRVASAPPEPAAGEPEPERPTPLQLIAIAPLPLPAATVESRPDLSAPLPAAAPGIEPEPGLAHRLGIVVFAGGFLLGDARGGGFQGTGRIDWGIGERWGLALQVGAGSPVAGSVGAGRIQASAQALALLVRLSLHPSDADSVSLLAGPAGFRLEVGATEYERSESAEFLDAGGAASLQWERRLWRGLSALVALDVAVRGHEEKLAIDGLGTVLDLSPVHLAAAVGLAWTFEMNSRGPSSQF